MNAREMSGSTVRRFTLEGFDPGRMTSMVQGGVLEHTQLTPGHFHGKLLQLQQQPTRIDWGRYTLPVLAEGELSRDGVTIGIVLHDYLPSRFNGVTLAARTILVFSEGHEMVTTLPADCHWVALLVPRKRLEQLGLDLPKRFFQSHALRGAGGSSVCRSVLGALGHIDRASADDTRKTAPDIVEPITDIEDTAIAALSRSGVFHRRSSAPPRIDPRASYALARRATDFMVGNIAQPISISSICGALNTTYRTLERAFLLTYGVPPKRYLAMRRLSKLRRFLLDGHRHSRNLTGLYRDCGLTHLGRAPGAYRAVFGEVPSATLRRTALS